jgi:hypothetical protein
LEFFHLGGFWPQYDGVKFLGVHFDTVSTNDKAEVFNESFVKFTLCCIGTKFCILEVFEDHGNMSVMFFLVLREDQNVVKIDHTYNVEKVM